MPLVEAKIKKELETAIIGALTKEFAKEGGADMSSHKRIAAAVAAGVAKILVQTLQVDAEVMPGIPTAGSPAAQVSVAPGKIS